jgi:hypothetical protein
MKKKTPFGVEKISCGKTKKNSLAWLLGHATNGKKKH